jgi:hypothetical protein
VVDWYSSLNGATTQKTGIFTSVTNLRSCTVSYFRNHFSWGDILEYRYVSPTNQCEPRVKIMLSITTGLSKTQLQVWSVSADNLFKLSPGAPPSPQTKSLSATWGRAMPWWQGINYARYTQMHVRKVLKPTKTEVRNLGDWVHITTDFVIIHYLVVSIVK